MKRPAVLLIAISLSLVGYTQNLRLNLEKGETYRQTSVSTINIKQDMGGQSMSIDMIVEGSVGFLIKEKTDDHYLMDVKYERMSLKMNSPFASMEMSSDNAQPDDKLSSLLSDMIGYTFEIKMKDNGAIIEINNLEEMFNAISEQSKDIPEMERNQLVEQLRQSYGQESFKNNMELLTSIYPENEVAVNDSWTSTRSLSSVMKMTLHNTFTLTELNDEFALINVATKGQAVEEEGFQDINGMPARYDMNGQMKGTIKIDATSGWILEGNIHQEFNGQIEIADNPQVPGGMNIPMEMISDIKISRD